ncbi:Uncharacterised protein [Streptococcus pneumoniae]|nr:Uncharacterised protein [Streptococcus pneumoniae]
MFWYIDFTFTSFKEPSVCGLNFEIINTNIKQTKYVTASTVNEPVNPTRVMTIPASIGPITIERDSESASCAFPFFKWSLSVTISGKKEGMAML